MESKESKDNKIPQEAKETQEKKETKEAQEKKGDNKTKEAPAAPKKDAPPRKENEFIIHYLLSTEKERRDKFEKEIKMYEKKLELTQMMEEEMRRKMMQRRDGMEYEIFRRLDETRKDKDKNDPIRKKREEERPVLKLDEEKLKLFGENFVQMNKKKCRLVIEGKEMELCEYYTTKSKNRDFAFNNLH